MNLIRNRKLKKKKTEADNHYFKMINILRNDDKSNDDD